MTEASALTEAERAVLVVLAEARTTSTVVHLCADLYQRGTDERFTFGDPIGFVTWLLEGLNANGYVIYRVRTGQPLAGEPEGFAGLPFAIHLTPKGWAACGYTHVTPEVGRNPGLREVSVADRTDYRTHHVFAEGGNIEHHPWYDCYLAVPLTGQEHLVAPTKTRTYVKVTPDMEERVIASYGRTGSYEKTAQETNVDERRVRYIVNDRPRLGRDSSSLKRRLLDLITERGPYFDIMALHKDIPGPHGLHNLVHVLHSLNKSGLIDFRTERKGADTNYLNIRVAKQNGQHLRVGEDSIGVLTLDPAPAPGMVIGPDLLVGEAMAEVAPTSEVKQEVQVESNSSLPPTGGDWSSRFPLLNELVSQREVKRQSEGKAASYLQAAEALEAADPVMAATLLDMAADVEGPSFSPIEAEYLAYHDAHSVE